MAIANAEGGQKVETHEVIVYLPYDYHSKEEWKGKLDLFVYSHRDPSIVCPLRDMAEGTARLVDSKARDVFYELCKPQTSVYFAVYSRSQHKERISKATDKFIVGISR